MRNDVIQYTCETCLRKATPTAADLLLLQTDLRDVELFCLIYIIMFLATSRYENKQ